MLKACEQDWEWPFFFSKENRSSSVGEIILMVNFTMR